MTRTGLRWIAAAGVAAALGAGPAGAVNVVLDYTYDTQGFFADPVAKATLEKAAADFSSLLTDSFGALVPYDNYAGNFGTFGWEYALNFTHPGNNSAPSVELVDEPIAANEYRIYAGGRAIGGSTLGRGGPGGMGWSFGTVSGQNQYFSSELAEINALSDAFLVQVNGRQDAGLDFRSWGGSITFDNDGSTNWHLDWQTQPAGGTSDLYSVALHEMAHALGFGGQLWETLVVDGFFTGAASTAANGANPVPTDPDDSHWIADANSTVLTGGDPQEPAMDPNLTTGSRKLLTDLDAAGLADIGWQINPAFTYVLSAPGDTDGDGDIDDSDLGTAFANYTGPLGAAGGKTVADGDTDGDGDVDDSDLGTLFANYTGPIASTSVPEPTAALMLAAAGLGLMGRHRRRFRNSDRRN